MPHPATRLLAALELLQTPDERFLSGPEIAERLGVSARTVRHYLNQLEDFGIPIERERGRYGGYRIGSGFKLPPLMFSEEEAVALTLSLRFAARHGLTLANPAVEGARIKVERVLPQRLRERVRQVQESVLFGDLPSPYPPPDSSLISLLSNAIQSRRCVRLRHLSYEQRQMGEEAPQARDVDPFGLVAYRRRWYLTGYCRLRDDLRVFRLDRIQGATVTHETARQPPGGFDPLAQVLTALASTPGVFTVEALLHTDIETARRQIPAEFALLEEMPEGVLLRCHVQQLDWVAHYLAGFELPLTLLGPPELRAALRELAVHVQRLADAGSDSAGECRP